MKNEQAVKNAAVEEKAGLGMDLSFEELEAKVAPAIPGVSLNHNETLVLESSAEQTELILEPTFEELEEKVAPGRSLNHNQTMLLDRM